jgi:hypothetical protein
MSRPHGSRDVISAARDSPELQGLRHEIEELRHQVAAGKSGH